VNFENIANQVEKMANGSSNSDSSNGLTTKSTKKAEQGSKTTKVSNKGSKVTKGSK